jgi:hypothetical protein
LVGLLSLEVLSSLPGRALLKTTHNSAIPLAFYSVKLGFEA